MITCMHHNDANCTNLLLEYPAEFESAPLSSDDDDSRFGESDDGLMNDYLADVSSASESWYMLNHYFEGLLTSM